MIDSLSDFKEFLSVHYFIHLAVSTNRQFGERTLTNNTLEVTKFNTRANYRHKQVY